MIKVFDIFEKIVSVSFTAIKEICKYIYVYIQHAIETTDFEGFYIQIREKNVCNKKHNCGPGKVHSPLPAHYSEASQPSSCTLQGGKPAPFLRTAGRPASLSYTGQGDTKVNCFKSLHKKIVNETHITNYWLYHPVHKFKKLQCLLHPVQHL